MKRSTKPKHDIPNAVEVGDEPKTKTATPTKKAAPKTATPKKAPPKKATPKKAPPKAEVEIDHPADEEIDTVFDDVEIEEDVEEDEDLEVEEDTEEDADPADPESEWNILQNKSDRLYYFGLTDAAGELLCISHRGYETRKLARARIAKIQQAADTDVRFTPN